MHEDVAFRVVGRNLHPDHATLARFRATFQEPLAGLFATVLALCARAGLIDLGLVAVDGTKLQANAASSSNHSADGLRKLLEMEAKRILDEAAAVDAAEDIEPSPPRSRLFAEREHRRERIRETLAELDAEREQAENEVSTDRELRARTKAEGRPMRGRPKGGAPAKPRRSTSPTPTVGSCAPWATGCRPTTPRSPSRPSRSSLQPRRPTPDTTTTNAGDWFLDRPVLAHRRSRSRRDAGA